MITVLGIDQAPAISGWAVFGDGWERPNGGIWRNNNFNDKPDRSFWEFRNRVAYTVKNFAPDAVFYEELLLRDYTKADSGKKVRDDDITIRNKAGLIVCIMLVCQEFGVPCYHAPINDWRNEFFLTRKVPNVGRKALKKMAVEMCAKRGWPVTGHDVAEAMAIAHFGLVQMSPDYAARSNLFVRT